MRDMKLVELDFLQTAPFKIVGERKIKATKETVFQFLKIAENWPKWHTLVTKVVWTSPEPFQKGTTRTVVLNDKYTADEDFLIWEENSRFTFRFIRCDIPFAKALMEDFELIDLEDGYCQLKWTIVFEFGGLLRLLSGVLTWVLKRMNNNTIEKTMQNLADYFDNS